jgi:putative acetyltransferase
MRIRLETPDDVAAIREVNRAAFVSKVEPDLVERLRAAGNLAISLVADDGGRIVSHAAYSPAVVELSRGESFDVAALGPIAVLPELQKRGLGAQLMERGFAECLALGYDLMFLLGHPSYYPRFGFVPAKALGVRWAPDTSGHPNPAFMVKELKPGALADRLDGDAGVFHYAPEFDGV